MEEARYSIVAEKQAAAVEGEEEAVAEVAAAVPAAAAEEAWQAVVETGFPRAFGEGDP